MGRLFLLELASPSRVTASLWRRRRAARACSSKSIIAFTRHRAKCARLRSPSPGQNTPVAAPTVLLGDGFRRPLDTRVSISRNAKHAAALTISAAWVMKMIIAAFIGGDAYGFAFRPSDVMTRATHIFASRQFRGRDCEAGSIAELRRIYNAAQALSPPCAPMPPRLRNIDG